MTILLMQALFHNEGTVWERKVGWELRVWDKEKYTGIVRQEWCIHFFSSAKPHMHLDALWVWKSAAFETDFAYLVFSKVKGTSV